MLAKLEFHRPAVADDVALEAELATQDVREEKLVPLDRDAVVVVVGSHHAKRAAVAHRPAKRREKNRLHVAPRDLRIRAGLAVAAALWHAVNGEVLQGRDDMLLLDAARFLDAELADQKRILAVALDDPPPPLVARHFENRRVDIRVAERAALAAGYAADPAHELAVERARDAKLRGKTRRLRVHQAADALVRKIRRHAE